jgi:hypothetical protein
VTAQSHVRIVGGATDAESNVKFATISASMSGNTSVVSAVTGRKLRVLSYTYVVEGAVDVKFTDESGDLTGAMTHGTEGEGVAVAATAGLFETTAGEALRINLSANINVRGHLSYKEVA